MNQKLNIKNKKIWRNSLLIGILAVLMSVLVSILALPNVSALEDIISARSFEQVNENTFDISVFVDVNDDVKAFILREQLPENVLIIDSGNGEIEERTNTIKWAALEGLESHPIKSEYTYRVEFLKNGIYVFDGFIVTIDNEIKTSGQGIFLSGESLDSVNLPTAWQSTGYSLMCGGVSQ